MSLESHKTKVASFRLSAEAHAKLTAQAKLAGVSGRVWFEQAILDNQTEIIARPQLHPELKPLLFQAAKAGNNLNQLAHRFNALRLEGRMSQQDCARALATLDEICRMFREAVSRAGSR